MKRIALLTALFLTTTMPVFSQFEGEIDMKISSSLTDEPKEQVIMMLIRKDMIAVSAKGGTGADKNARVIFREDKKVMWVLDDAKKTAMEIPTKEIENLGANVPKDAKPDKVTFRKNGKTETILGYTCEGWTVEEELETKEVYGTSKLGNILEGFLQSLKRMTGGRMESMMNEFEVEMLKKQIFPLKSITLRDGKVVSTQEVTKIDRRSLPKSTFEVPAGYEKKSLSAEMQGMRKQMEEQMKKMKEQGEMTPEMQKMLEEQMKHMGGGGADSSKDADDEENDD